MAQAMDVGDEDMQSTIPSRIITLESESPEDIAWADSCLTKESDISDDNWDSLKGALLEILDSQSESLSSSVLVTVSDGLSGETDIEVLPSSEGAETEDFQRTNNRLPINEAAERRDDDMPADEDTNNLQSSTFTGNPFLPGYNDDLRVTENDELEASVDYSVSEMEPLTEDIFKVWDLDVQVEEDELVKQLNKALEDSLPQSVPSTKDDSDDVWKKLIAGIADLSLDQNSS